MIELGCYARMACAAWMLLGCARASLGESPIEAEWDSLDAPGLTKLAKDLLRDARYLEFALPHLKTTYRPESVAAFHAYLPKRYERTSTGTQLDWDHRLELTALLGGSFHGRVKASFVRDIKGLLEGRHADEGMSRVRLGRICDALVSLGACDAAGELALEWAAEPSLLQTTDIEGLPGLARALAAAPTACGGDEYWSARRRIVSYLTWRVLESKSAITSLSWDDWRRLVGALQQDLSEPARQLWVSRLEATYVGLEVERGHAGKAAFAELILTLLDGQPGLAASWVSRSSLWRQWEGPNLTRLAVVFAQSAGRDTQAARGQLISHLTSEYLSSGRTATCIDGRGWKLLALVLRRDLTPRQRQAWIEGLRSGFFDCAAGVEEFGKLSYPPALEALYLLEDPHAIDRVAAFIEESSAWRGWSIDESLEQLAHSLRNSEDRHRAARLRLAEHILAQCVEGPHTVRAPGLNLRTWLHLATRFNNDLSQRQRLWWGRHLADALLGDAEALQWSLDNENNCFCRLDEMFQPLIGQTIEECLYRRHLADPSQTRLIPPALWARLAGQLEAKLTHEDRVAWVEALRKAFLEPDASAAESSDEDRGRLVLALGALRDTDADRLAVAWVNSSDAWRTWLVEELRHLSRLLILPGDGTEDEDLSSARRRVQEHIVEELLSRPAAVREAGSSPWAELAGHLAADMSDDGKLLWGSRLLAAYAGNAEALIGLTLDQRGELAEALKALSQPGRGQMIRKTWLAESAAVVMFADHMLGPELWNIELRLLFGRVIAAKPQDRPQVWRHGVRRLSVYPASLSADACHDLKRLTELRDFPDNAVPCRIVDDLIAMCRDEISTPQLQTIRCEMRLREALADAPVDFAELVSQAEMLPGSGQPEEAIGPLGEAIERFGQAGGANIPARTMLIELLLDQGMSGAEEIRRHLEIIAQDSAAGEEFLWNVRCRLLMRDVCAAPPPDRPAAWREGLESLEAGADGVLIYEKTLKDVDRFVAFLRGGEGITLAPLEVLTDLMLLTPHRRSMGSLQARRVVALSGAGRSADADAAFGLGVLLSVGARGPVEYLSLAESAGVSTPESGAWEDVLEAALAPAGQNGLPQTPARDPALMTAAKERLSRLAESASTRRRGWLSLLAGDAQAALEQGRLDLNQAGQTWAQSRAIFEDLAARVAVADGRINSCHRLTRSFIESPAAAGRAAEAALVLEAWSQKLSFWALGAAQQGRDGLAGALWGMSVVSRPQGESCVAAEVICNAGRRLYASERLLEMLGAMAPHVRQTRAGEAPLRTMASLLYEGSRPQECLEVLDRLETLNARTGTKPAIADGILRAVCLIDLGNHDQAVEGLREMADWDATETEYSQVLFLTGWALFQDGNRQEALAAFKRAGASSPGGMFAERTERLIRLLEGGAW